MNKILIGFLVLVLVGSAGLVGACNTQPNGDNHAQDPQEQNQDQAQAQAQDQDQAQGQAQGQAQSSVNQNNNTNTADSDASANNNVTVSNTNTNTFNPVININNQNVMSDISLSNQQYQTGEQNQNNEQTFTVPSTTTVTPGAAGGEFEEGTLPLILGTTTNAAAAGGEGVGLEETGFNISSLLIGLCGVLGGLAASRFGN